MKKAGYQIEKSIHQSRDPALLDYVTVTDHDRIWRRSIDHIRFITGLTLYVVRTLLSVECEICDVISRTVFEILVENRDFLHTPCIRRPTPPLGRGFPSEY